MENLTFAFLHKRNWDSVVDRIGARGPEIVQDSKECLFQKGHFMSGVHPASYLIHMGDIFYTYTHILFRILLRTKLLRRH